MATRSQTSPMVDPYEPEAGREAQQRFREQRGSELTNAILTDEREIERTREALRHVSEGDLRPRLGDT